MDKLDRPIVKICGISEARSAHDVVESGASAMGFIFADSRRKVGPGAVAAILDELSPERPPAAGVFVNESAERVEAIARAARLDVVQLSGDESPGILVGLERPVWKVFRFPAGTSLDEASRQIDPWTSHRRPVVAILVDAAVDGHYGGTGQRADWGLAAQLAGRYPLILAGGLNPGNVADAIQTVRPIGVDVSSGVELDGRKDVKSIRSFVSASLKAFARLR